MLAVGDCAVPYGNKFHLPSSTDRAWWREWLTFKGRENRSALESTLAALLDRVAARGDTPVSAVLGELTTGFIAERKQQRQFDWRYYFARYPVMRDGRSGLYATEGENMGYALCMLDKERMYSNYRDPFLEALRVEAKLTTPATFFTGGAESARWMAIAEAGVTVRCRSWGWEIRENGISPQIDMVIARHCRPTGESGAWRLEIVQESDPQATEFAGNMIDTEDRIEKAAALVFKLQDAVESNPASRTAVD